MDAKAWTDCIRFQETLLDQKLLLIAVLRRQSRKGAAKNVLARTCVSFKQRMVGELLLSLQIPSPRRGRATSRFLASFAHFRADCIILTNECSVDCVGQLHQEKKAGRPVSLTLQPNSELLSQLKMLQIQFLHENGESHLSPAAFSTCLGADRFFLIVAAQKRFCEIVDQAVGPGVT